MNPSILFEDNHCLVLNKPPGLAAAHALADEDSLDLWAKRYLKLKYAKQGNVFLGIVHRLDKPVSGVIVFARTSKAASRLSKQFREGTIDKRYWAVVVGQFSQSSGQLEHWLQQKESDARVQVVAPHTHDAKVARLSYQVRDHSRGLTLLEVQLHTGRKHQIRAQLAAAGWPIVGDRKYGSTTSVGPGIALHARSLHFDHPTKSERIEVVAELPDSWNSFLELVAGQT